MLSTSERTKDAKLSSLKQQTALLKQLTPAPKPDSTLLSAQTPSSEPSDACTQIRALPSMRSAVPCSAAASKFAQATAQSLLISPPRRVILSLHRSMLGLPSMAKPECSMWCDWRDLRCRVCTRV